MESDRYIILSDQIIDREKLARIYRDPEDHNKLWLVIPGEPDVAVTGADAIQLWRMFDGDPGWQ
jgi:hypothetical protein